MAKYKKKLRPEIKEFIGSKGWIWFWIIIFWPIAVFYWIGNREYPSKIKYQ